MDFPLPGARAPQPVVGRRARWRFAIALSIALASCIAAARAADVGAALAELFESGAKATPTAIEAAREQYEALKRAQGGDPRVDYAYAVVLVNQHRSADALPLVTRYLESDQPAVGAYGVKIWAEIHSKSYPDALRSAAALSERFPRAAAGQPDDEFLAAARLLGTVFGYFELARSGAVKPDFLADRRNQVVHRLGAGYAPAFDEGHAAVARRIDELRAADQERAAKRKERDKDVAADARDDADQRTESIESITRQQERAEKDLAAVRKSFRAAQQQYAQSAANVNQLELLIKRERSQRNSNQQRIARWKSELHPLEKQAKEARRQVEQSERQAADLQSAIADRAKSIEKLQRLARQDDRRGDEAEERGRRPPTASGPLADRLASLATYAPFPYEQEKERVLKWFSR